jgi:hypothetical protein
MPVVIWSFEEGGVNADLDEAFVVQVLGVLLFERHSKCSQIPTVVTAALT